MRYELMFPHQICKAIDEKRRCILPLGVLEYPSASGVCQIARMEITRPKPAYYNTLGHGT